MPRSPRRILTRCGRMPEAEYLALPEIKTVLLKDIFSGIVLFLYVDPSVKDPIFKFAIEAGIQKGGRISLCLPSFRPAEVFP